MKATQKNTSRKEDNKWKIMIKVFRKTINMVSSQSTKKKPHITNKNKRKSIEKKGNKVIRGIRQNP